MKKLIDNWDVLGMGNSWTSPSWWYDDMNIWCMIRYDSYVIMITIIVIIIIDKSKFYSGWNKL